MASICKHINKRTAVAEQFLSSHQARELHMIMAFCVLPLFLNFLTTLLVVTPGCSRATQIVAVWSLNRNLRHDEIFHLADKDTCSMSQK